MVSPSASRAGSAVAGNGLLVGVCRAARRASSSTPSSSSSCCGCSPGRRCRCATSVRERSSARPSSRCSSCSAASSSATPAANPLLGAVAVSVGLLFWLNLMSKVILLSAAWAANDVDLDHLGDDTQRSPMAVPCVRRSSPRSAPPPTPASCRMPPPPSRRPPGTSRQPDEPLLARHRPRQRGRGSGRRRSGALAVTAARRLRRR